MSTYLDKLIESVKADINREHERMDHITLHTKRAEQQEAGTLKRLEQRLAVLEQLKVAEKNRRRPSGTRRSRFFEA